MALDLHAIATGLAARYSAANVTPPSGLRNIQGATAKPPNNIPQTPYVVVFPPSGEVRYESRTERKGEHEFPVVFFIAKQTGDVPRQAEELLKWLGVLLDQTHPATKLGLAPTVDKAIPTSYEAGVVTYGGATWLGITITVRVWTTDTIDLVAA